MSDITPINPYAGLPDEDPIENLLDEESDEDFGYVVTRDRANGPDGHPVKLADWSAQDFASIYTRFRPHIERHARRFLNNPSQVDEVVQDAFLYLMVSLPELDSEIGVLRFLKWKTRLLCLDVIRASGKAYVANIDDVAEPMSSDPEVSSYLEQQDDAAVLRLALSKLNPRHREVLLASIYEEKSTEEIASQVGLSENATRQLIFRARSAFKKALLGDDVNTEGMSAAAILSVAARKASQEAKKVGAQAMVLVLFLMLAIGAFVSFTGRGNQTQQLAEQKGEPQPALTPQVPVSTTPVTDIEVVQNLQPVKALENLVQENTFTPPPAPSPSAEASTELVEFASKAASLVNVSNTVIASSVFLDADSREILTVRNGQLSAKFEFSGETESISSLQIRLEVGDDLFRAFPYSYSSAKQSDGSVLFSGQIGYLLDSKSRLITGNPLQVAWFQLKIQCDGGGRVYFADLKILN